MTPFQRTALRAACLIRQRIVERWHSPSRTAFPDGFCHRLHRLLRLIEIARYRAWPAAVRHLTQDLAREVECSRQRLVEFAHQLQQTSPKHLPTEAEIFHEIMAVQDEFGEVEIDLAEGAIAITTDPIVLDDMHLGPFQIRLDIGRLPGRQSYRCVALEPNPAAANEAVTHPHVQDERLCEGDGRAAIESALNAGRLCDFFLIVSRLLNTYARGSAYIEISDWEGIRCQDCGGMTYEDDRCHCERCDSDLCGECCLSCQGCQRGLCSECMTTCHRCGENYCRSCLTACRSCHEKCCENCLEDGLCENCHDQPDDDVSESDAEGSADTPEDVRENKRWISELLENTGRAVPTARAGATV
jgi:hypothetical protein